MQRLLAKIDNFTGVARFDFIEQSNIDNAISFDRDRAVLRSAGHSSSQRDVREQSFFCCSGGL